MEAFLPLLVFVFIGGMVLYGYWMLSQRRRRLQRRLRGPDDPEDVPELLLGDMTPALAAQIPISDDNRGELQRELRAAGYYRPTAVIEYAALRTLLTIPAVVAGGSLALFAETSTQATYCWIGGIVVALLGYSLPRVYISDAAPQPRFPGRTRPAHRHRHADPLPQRRSERLHQPAAGRQGAVRRLSGAGVRAGHRLPPGRIADHRLRRAAVRHPHRPAERAQPGGHPQPVGKPGHRRPHHPARVRGQPAHQHAAAAPRRWPTGRRSSCCSRPT